MAQEPASARFPSMPERAVATGHVDFVRPPEVGRDRIGGVLLAAGLSSRMGRNKMLLDVDGESLVRRAARRALDGGISPLVVVLGARADMVRRELEGLACETIVNSDYGSGMASSLRVGVRAMPAVTGAFVLLADMPYVSSDMYRQMIRRHSDTRALVVISDYGGVRAPPILYDARVFSELSVIPNDGRGRDVADRYVDRSVTMRWPATLLRDVDVLADYAALGANPLL